MLQMMALMMVLMLGERQTMMPMMVQQWLQMLKKLPKQMIARTTESKWRHLRRSKTSKKSQQKSLNSQHQRQRGDLLFHSHLIWSKMATQFGWWTVVEQSTAEGTRSMRRLRKHTGTFRSSTRGLTSKAISISSRPTLAMIHTGISVIQEQLHKCCTLWPLKSLICLRDCEELSFLRHASFHNSHLLVLLRSGHQASTFMSSVDLTGPKETSKRHAPSSVTKLASRWTSTITWNLKVSSIMSTWPNWPQYSASKISLKGGLTTDWALQYLWAMSERLLFLCLWTITMKCASLHALNYSTMPCQRLQTCTHSILTRRRSSVMNTLSWQMITRKMLQISFRFLKVLHSHSKSQQMHTLSVQVAIQIQLLMMKMKMELFLWLTRSIYLQHSVHWHF